MRLACAAAEKDLLEFFERWGMTPNEGTRAYAQQFAPETRAIWCTGTRSGDMGLRMLYGGWDGELNLSSNLKETIQKAVASGDTVYVVATYTALVPARNAILEEVRS